MAAIQCEIRISDGTTYGAGTITDSQLFLPRTSISQVVGLLDSNEKINIGLMPSFMFGGQKFFDTLQANKTAGALFKDICFAASGAGLDDLNLFAGRFFQAGVDVEISLGQLNVTKATDPAVYKYLDITVDGVITFLCEPDDGVEPTTSVKLESNDYLVFRSFTPDADGGTAYFGVVNNTYGNATTSEKGVVSLASDTDITTGTNTTRAVTPAGAKLAVQTFGYKHPTYNASIGTLSSLKAITSITTENGHVTAITTADIPTATFNSLGVLKNATDADSKKADLTYYNEGYAVSPQIAKNMIDYWGKIEYFATLAEANASPTKNVTGKMVLVGV